MIKRLVVFFCALIIAGVPIISALIGKSSVAEDVFSPVADEEDLAFGDSEEQIPCEEIKVLFEDTAGGCPAPNASAAVLIEARSAKVLFEMNGEERLPMASTTKLMTAIVVCENLPLDKIITVGKESVGIEGSSMYLFEGEEISVETLLYGLLLESANDAATALAYACSGSVEAFAELMNKKALEMGLENTSFTNPHGLDDEEHYTTARELGMIGIKALENETVKKIVSTKSHRAAVIGKEASRYMVNHNRLLYTYEGAIGMKTGFTKRTGRCLVSAAERDGMTLVCVTLHAADDWNAHRKMLDFGFQNYKITELSKSGSEGFPFDCIGGEMDKIMTKTNGGLFVLSNRDDDLSDIDFFVETVRPIFAPIYKGEVLGKLVFYKNGEKLWEIPIVSDEDNPEREDKRNIFEKIRDHFSAIF